ncbi:argininosuccinate lyase [bacterium]|nr:argininosuccinate lyase [bacterium]NCQ55522.1 argininosuccinate lyase [Candidatus Parcubacteria bacterium]NCS67533.1 argininosuccinate lyase [Candidatus Peregrinibacteria bacterium]NCS96302.1 argininosuccinate lyase [bacterium]
MTLWKTDSIENNTLQNLIEKFTVGNDPQLDQTLVPYDVDASIAHAEGLASIHILNVLELKKIIQALEDIKALHAKSHFPITQAQEDCHTAIEDFLVEKLGDTGKKIHTGRSRNDQVLVAMRLWERDTIDQIIYSTKELALVFISFASKYEFMPMPGFTHTQIAMPSSIGMWAGSISEMLLLNIEALTDFRKTLNRSPLGSAAGFGVGFNLPREEMAQSLGFDGCLQVALTSQNMRGKIEADFVSQLVSLSATLAHFANDLVWFSSSPFQFFDVAPELTTGSSIMPQKRNLDPAELLRGSHSHMLGHECSLRNLSSHLISGYHRDLQLSKEPTMKAVNLIQSMLEIAQALIENIMPNEEALIKAFTPEIFAADKANTLVKKGVPFRKAYLQVKKDLSDIKPMTKAEILENLKCKTHLGASGNLGLDLLRQRLTNS